MRASIIIISVILLTALIVGGLIVLGPLRWVLPQSTRETLDNTIPDYFSAANRPPVSGGDASGDTQSGLGTGNTATTTATSLARWTLPGSSPNSHINVLRFTDAASTTTTNAGTALPTGNVFITQGGSTTPYTILYFSHDQSFMISLEKEPLGETRTVAEQAFMNKLGITEEEACDLRYAVAVPYAINAFYVNKNLGFSFCPGATKL